MQGLAAKLVGFKALRFAVTIGLCGKLFTLGILPAIFDTGSVAYLDFMLFPSMIGCMCMVASLGIRNFRWSSAGISVYAIVVVTYAVSNIKRPQVAYSLFWELWLAFWLAMVLWVNTPRESE